MELNHENVKTVIKDAKILLDKEQNISPALRSEIQVLLMFVKGIMPLEFRTKN